MLGEKSWSESVDVVEDYCKYLNKKVLLKTTRSSHLGSLKCIDPLTQSVAIIVHDIHSNASKVVIAMSHSIKSIQLVDHDNQDDNSDNFTFDFEQLLPTSAADKIDKSFTEQELNDRKAEVIRWLKVNHIPVEEADDGSLIIAYALTLKVPYSKEHCICANEIVLGKIQSLLDSMPKIT